MQLRARSHLLKSNWHRKKQTRRNGGFVRLGLLFLERILCVNGIQPEAVERFASPSRKSCAPTVEREQCTWERILSANELTDST